MLRVYDLYDRPKGDTSILYSVKIILYLSRLNHPLGIILIENNLRNVLRSDRILYKFKDLEKLLMFVRLLESFLSNVTTKLYKEVITK